MVTEMSATPTPEDIAVVLRHIEHPQGAQEYAMTKLGPIIRGIPDLRHAQIEVTFEHTRPLEQQYVVQATIATGGDVVRAEERGQTPQATIDAVHDLLERRIRDWKTRLQFRRRQLSIAAKEQEWDRVSATPPQEQMGRIVRRKIYELKPMFPEDAIEQMELLGHDFYFFTNAETGQQNVVYRRRVGGFGLIEPATGSETRP